ncbi:MAG TPA: flagella basal body P-ring formation protein FlgA [Terracidiphilus sp.]|jgi:hypothetical protein|nr:flagella basal body P-ring formation protein FlgA [Terracidiphilus sp.]
MKQVKTILIWMAVAAAASPALAAPARYIISTQQVAAAVSTMGIEVAPDQVTLLADAVASTNTPHLTVRSMQRWGNQRMMARLQCESSDQCLPFMVSLRVNSAADAQSGGNTGQTPAQVLVASGARDFAVRGGTPATLMLEGPRVHIRLQVICLENGARGQTIRVTDRERKRVYRAQVVDGGLLQGKL